MMEMTDVKPRIMTNRHSCLIQLILLFSLITSYSCAASQQFDQTRAKLLSVEARQKYDVVFFNEMKVWNLNSNRYQRDSFSERREEFERMAADGYLPAYAALRLVKIGTSIEQHDPEALKMLLDAASQGDASAMCALVVIPIRSDLMPEKQRMGMRHKMIIQAAEAGQGACMGSYGTALLFGTTQDIAQDRQAAIPLLLESARQGYYIAADSFFGFRYIKALQHSFDFTDSAELERAMCWGRLAEQFTNWAGFSDGFLDLLRDYARKNDRPDLVEKSYEFDARHVHISVQAVQPEDCIKLEKGI